MSKDITIVWRRFEDIEVGDIVSRATGYDVSGWVVVEAVRQVDVRHGLIENPLSFIQRTVELTIPHSSSKITDDLISLIQVQVENFS